MRPPKECGRTNDGQLSDRPRRCIWKLTKFPYVIVEAGRQWLCDIEEWMVGTFGMERVPGMDLLFIKRKTDGTISLLVAKVVDDLLISGPIDEIKHLFERRNKSFTLGATCVNNYLKFLGCNIQIDDDGSAAISMKSYLDRVRTIQLSRTRRRQSDQLFDDRERSEYRSLAGVFLNLGQAVLSELCLLESKIQQKLGMFKLAHLASEN